MEVDVGQEEGHGAALGDLPGLVQIALRTLGAGAGAGENAQPGAGEEAAGEVVLPARVTEAGYGVLEGRVARVE
jgi:hypothetical protein